MPLAWNIVRVVVAAVVIVTVAELSKRNPRVGGLLLSLPLISRLKRDLFTAESWPKGI